MTSGFILWAQALDNSSPDHIAVRGAALDAEDSLRRQEAVSLVSHVIKDGVRIFESRGVRLTADNRHFIVEIPSAQRDLAGRTAPIVCCGEYDSSFEETLGAKVADTLNEFARRIGRNLHSEQLELVRGSFAELKKKLLRRTLVRAATRTATVLALLMLTYWLASKGL